MILRSLLYYWRTNLGVALAAAVATAAITGALLVGDSVRFTLRQAALSRLADVQLAMHTGERFFTTPLAQRLDGVHGARATAVLHLPAVASMPGADPRVGAVQLLGVADQAFFSMGRAEVSLQAEEVVLNTPLAERLGARRGDVVLLRLAKPTALSGDIPLSGEAGQTVSMRLRVGSIADDEQFGRFSLRAEQTSPLNAFVPLRALQRAVGLDGRANLILIGSSSSRAAELPSAIAAALRERWTLADAQLELRQVPDAELTELRTERVFLDPSVVEGLGAAAQQGATYFVHEIRADGRATPYSMVTGLDPAESDLLPDDMADNQIVITDWLSEDLGARAGDSITLRYYRLGDARRLVEQEATFSVRAVIPTEARGGDRSLMPEFPGLTDAESPLDWEPPPDLNIDLARIRPKDEQYWKDHRGAPKAFVTLNWAREHWSTRFGVITSLRWPAEKLSVPEIESLARESIDPASLGLFFRDVRTPALKAASEGYDFGQLFLGLSGFVVIAAMLLTVLMFAFGVEQRTPQTGVLLAMGFTAGRVRRWFIGEGLALTLIGAAIGVPLGVAYTRGVLWGLENLWQAAIGQIALRYHAQPMSLLIGGLSGIVVALLSMLWVLRRQGRQPVRALLAARYGIESPEPRRGANRVLALAGGLAGGAIALTVAADPEFAAGAFFGAGALLLLAGIVAGWAILRPSKPRVHPRLATPTITSIGWRGASRRRGRSIATIAMLACGTFLLVAINAFRHDPSHAPHSATLGYELFGQTTIPVPYDLNSPAGREALGIDDRDLNDVRIVQARLLEGDEASCLNLNRPQAPPLLGVDLRVAGAESAKPRLSSPSPVSEPGLRKASAPATPIPALVDESVARWVLDVKVGDTLEYVDDRGQSFHVRIADLIPRSILQGYLIVGEDDFKQRFPSQSGYRVFLIDAPPDRAAAVRQSLERALADYGMTITTTAERLAAFNAIENTYLSIFSVLGGLGVLLGCAGLALVLLRNVLERRSELALMRAVGFRDVAIRKLLLAEHWGLVAMGLVCGVVSAVLAVIPALRQRQEGMPITALAVILAAIAAAALLWTGLAARFALRGRLMQALRSE